MRTVRFAACPLSVRGRPFRTMVELRRPNERTCQNCGRQEAWDSEEENWVVDGDVGAVYCLHSWDITGEFSPVSG